LARERKPPGTVLQKAYGILDAYGLPRNYFVETNQDNCEIVSDAPDIVPSNPVPDTATRTPVKEVPSKSNDDTPEESTNGEKLAGDKVPLESVKSPSTIENVPKTPSETTHDNNTASETSVTPEEIKVPSGTVADIKESKV
jgi:apolipoprotein D and lipocalin family protein